ncbi:MAG: EthD domain-containing protein [Myxococcota bacterium]
MEKVVYLLGLGASGAAESDGRDARDARIALRERLLALAEPLAAAGARRARAAVADIDDARADASFRLDAHGHGDAAVSLWLDSIDARGPVERALAGAAARCAGYLVTESVPLAPAAGVAPGARIPGVALVTSFDKPAALDDDAFYARWHGSHTPLSLEIHPLLHYVRNAVVRPLTPGAPPLRAIVSEAVASVDVIADPAVFYGSEEGRARAVADLRTFVDFRSLATALMSEYVLVA